MPKGPEAPTFQGTQTHPDLPMGQWDEEGLKKLEELPESVRAIALAYGPDYDYSFNPAEEIARIIFKPEELTPEAVERAWQDAVHTRSLGHLSPAFGPGERPTASQYFSATTRHLRTARETTDEALKARSLAMATEYSKGILGLPANELADVGQTILQINVDNPLLARDALRVFRGTHVMNERQLRGALGLSLRGPALPNPAR